MGTKTTTSKKTKVVGVEQYINTSTGELENFQVIKLEQRDFNFHKVWLEHILYSLDLIGNKKTKLAFWIVDNLKSENLLTMNYRQIAKGSGMSLDTVQSTMKALIESDFLKRINNGCYQVNPDVLFKGGHHGRMKVLYDYQTIQGEQLSLFDEPEVTETTAEEPAAIVNEPYKIYEGEQNGFVARAN
jgi:hypothetical protein